MIEIVSKAKKHKVLALFMFMTLAAIFTVLIISLTKSPDIHDYGQADHKAIDVSIIALIADPEKYEGKLVRVQGVSSITYEGKALFLSTDDYNNIILKNALWISPDYKALNTDDTNLRKMNGKYVIIEGVFDPKNKGQFDLL